MGTEDKSNQSPKSFQVIITESRDDYFYCLAWPGMRNLLNRYNGLTVPQQHNGPAIAMGLGIEADQIKSNPNIGLAWLGWLASDKLSLDIIFIARIDD